MQKINNAKLHVSYSVSKLGASIPSVNLPAIITCRKNAPCSKGCYACKGNFVFKNVQRLLNRNLALWRESPAEFEQEASFHASLARFFRWHSSGDIVDAEYFEMMVRVALQNPATEFLAFTKKFEIVNEWMGCNGRLPENLHVVYSSWGNFVPENPYNLPTAWVRLRKQELLNSLIPENARECSGYCGQCATTKGSCWKMKTGDAVVFNQH